MTETDPPVQLSLSPILLESLENLRKAIDREKTKCLSSGCETRRDKIMSRVSYQSARMPQAIKRKHLLKVLNEVLTVLLLILHAMTKP